MASSSSSPLKCCGLLAWIVLVCAMLRYDRVTATLSSSSVPYACNGVACERPGHDPSALQRTSEGFWVTLVTGSGQGEAFGMKYLQPNATSSDGWYQGQDSFLTPDWITDYLYPEGCDSACPFWAPDLVTSGNGIEEGGDRFVMYYSVAVPNEYGRACIGRAEGIFSSEKHPPSIEWKDAGSPVVCSNESSVEKGGPHAIDPSVSVDSSGRWWLTFGSWSDGSVGYRGGGVWVVELNATSGMLGDAARVACPGRVGETQYPTPFCWNRAFRNIANNPCEPNSGQCRAEYDNTNSIEASYLYHHRALRGAGGSYFLFTNYFWCCRGEQSTYEIRVARSSRATGPFLDKNGIPTEIGGGTLLLRNTSIAQGGFTEMVGPGHAGIAYDPVGDTYVFTFDFQGVVDSSGGLSVFATQARVLRWDDGGWPVVTGLPWGPRG